MTRVVVKTELLETLQKQSGPVEVCNETGEVVGQFIPKFDPSQYEPWEPPPLSEEEMRRREQSDEWYTTEQVLAHLKGLENQ